MFCIFTLPYAWGSLSLVMVNGRLEVWQRWCVGKSWEYFHRCDIQPDSVEIQRRAQGFPPIRTLLREQ